MDLNLIYPSLIFVAESLIELAKTNTQREMIMQYFVNAGRSHFSPTFFSMTFILLKFLTETKTHKNIKQTHEIRLRKHKETPLG